MIGLIIFLASFLPLVYLSWDRDQFFFAEEFEHFGDFDRSIVFLSMIIMLMLYSAFFFLIPSVLKFSVRQMYYWLIPVVMLLALTPPVLSMDAGSYLIYAKSFFSYGQNPFLVTLSSFSGNPWVAELSSHWWTDFTSPYGPVFTLLLAPVVFFSQHLLVTVLLYKMLLVGVYVACLALCQRLVRLYKLPESITLLFALNPSLLIHGILEGHNDLLILFFLLLAMYWFSSHWAKSVLALSLGVAIKIIPGLLLPVYLANNRQVYWKRILPSLGIVVGVFVVAFLPFGFPFQAFFHNLALQSQLECFYACSPVIRLVAWAWPQPHAWLWPVISIPLLITIWYFMSWKSLKVLEYLFWSQLVLLFLLSPALTPWYSLCAISIGILLSSRLHYRLLTIVLIAYSFGHYFGV